MSGTPAVSRNATSATPLSMSSSPTIWETALRRVDEHEEAEQHGRQPDRREMGRRARAAAP